MKNLAHYDILAFVVLLVAEVAVTAWQQRDYYNASDTASSLAMGIGNVAVGLVGKALVRAVYTLVMTMQAVSLLYQFWIHTEHIRCLPAPIEWLFNAPSHHRVYHNSGLAYLDKNHAGILILWDRLFGTLELEAHRPPYGLTKNVDSHNPIRIAFHEWTDMATDIRRAGTFRNALGYVFGPPGWSHDGSRKMTKQLQKGRV